MPFDRTQHQRWIVGGLNEGPRAQAVAEMEKCRLEDVIILNQRGEVDPRCTSKKLLGVVSQAKSQISKPLLEPGDFFALQMLDGQYRWQMAKEELWVGQLAYEGDCTAALNPTEQSP